MKKESKYEGAWGDYSGDGPGLIEFMAPRIVGMLLALVGIVVFISGIQCVSGVSPTLLQELWMQLFR